MTLYYEDDPADQTTVPQLPPLLRAVEVPAGQDVLAKAVAAEDLDEAVEAEVAPYLACAPGAVAKAKALVAALEPRVNDAVVDMTIAALVDAWESDEGPEGVSAFFEKRKPSWQQG